MVSPLRALNLQFTCRKSTSSTVCSGNFASSRTVELLLLNLCFDPLYFLHAKFNSCTLKMIDSVALPPCAAPYVTAPYDPANVKCMMLASRCPCACSIPFSSCGRCSHEDKALPTIICWTASSFDFLDAKCKHDINIINNYSCRISWEMVAQCKDNKAFRAILVVLDLHGVQQEFPVTFRNVLIAPQHKPIYLLKTFIGFQYTSMSHPGSLGTLASCLGRTK